LYELCNYSKLNAMEKQEYEKSILEYEGVKDAVECAREDGERDGFEKGIERGREEGREEGRAEGIEEGVINERTKLILAMFSNGMDIDTISKMTGLTKDKVEDIRGGHYRRFDLSAH